MVAVARPKSKVIRFDDRLSAKLNHRSRVCLGILAGARPSLTAIFTKSAREPAFIFCIILPQWAFPLLVCQVTFMAHSCVDAVKQSAQRPVGRRLVELLPEGRQFAGQTTRVAKPELSGCLDCVVVNLLLMHGCGRSIGPLCNFDCEHKNRRQPFRLGRFLRR
jgi:hypothetical protein